MNESTSATLRRTQQERDTLKRQLAEAQDELDTLRRLRDLEGTDDPANLREPTQAECNIARAWVDRHRFTHAQDAEVEYAHALAILVFGNARPPLKGKKGQPRLRDHAGLGLPCTVCQGPCTIDDPS